jgi:uncharacterized protein YqiB (DUF1249 family)
MHVEHNVSKSVLKYLFGEKDTMDVRKDLLKARMMWHLWLHQQHGCANYINHKPYLYSHKMNVRIFLTLWQKYMHQQGHLRSMCVLRV